MYKPPVCRQAVPDEKFYPRSLAQHQARLRPLGTSCADAKLTCPGQIQITPHCAAASMPSADENFSRSGVVQGNKHCTHLRPGATFDKPSEASPLGNDNRNNPGHTLARTFARTLWSPRAFGKDSRSNPGHHTLAHLRPRATFGGQPQQPGASRILRALVHALGQAVPTRRNLRRISRTGVCDGKPPGPVYPSPIRNVANRCKVAESPRSRAKIAPPLPIRNEQPMENCLAGAGFAKLSQRYQFGM
jgi:hypothetical protein